MFIIALEKTARGLFVFTTKAAGGLRHKTHFSKNAQIQAENPL
jgi:hypothetical protein